MNKRYYIANPEAPKGFEELTEEEFIAIVGEEPNRSYANKVYRGTMSMDEVPEENREAVTAIVETKIAKWGEYDQREVPAYELQTMIEEVL